MVRFQFLINTSYLLILLININLLEIFSSSDVNIFLFISSFAVYLLSIFSGIFSSSTIPTFIANQEEKHELIFAAIIITTLFYLMLACIPFFLNSFKDHLFLFLMTMINSYFLSLFALFSNISYSENKLLFPAAIQVLSSFIILITMNFLDELLLYAALHAFLNLISSVILIKKLNIIPKLNFNKRLYKKLLSSWSSIIMSSSFSRFDIVQDRFILSSTGAIPAYHYSRVVVDVFNLLLTRAYLIKDLIDSSNNTTNVNNYFFTLFLILISVFFLTFEEIVNFFGFLELKLFTYLGGFQYLYLFAISAFGSSLYVNKFYGKNLYWIVSIPSSIISSMFIIFKYFSTGFEVTDLLILLSLRIWLNFIFLNLIYFFQKEPGVQKNIYPFIVIFTIGVTYIGEVLF